VQAVGFDTTLALVPFASVTDPLPQGYRCANLRDDAIETLTAPVERGRAYAIQVAGARGAAGVLQVGFTFLADRDGDGVTDEKDRCPAKPGTTDGCPAKIAARVGYRYDGSANGVIFRYLQVSDAPPGSVVDVRCSLGCPHHRVKVRSKRMQLKSFRGRFIRVRATIEVRVTRPGWIGAYTRFTVSAGDVTSTDRCLPPGSTVPRRSCD
jgi:hypothetical protein